MGDFSDSLSAVALRLLTEKGQQVTFSRETTSGFNPATGVNTTSTSTYQCYGHPSNYNANEIDGEIIRRGDIRLLIENSTAPLLGDTVTIDSIVYRVMSVRTTSAQGADVIYTVQLRK